MKPVEIEFLMKDGLSKGVDKSRAGVEQLLDASRRLDEVLSQSGEEGARASDKYNSKLVGLRQGVEKMSASLKAMGVSGLSRHKPDDSAQWKKRCALPWRAGTPRWLKRPRQKWSRWRPG